MRPFAAALVLGLLLPGRAAAQDAPPAVARDRLPVLGTVGDLPPEKERVIVEVLPTSAIRVGRNLMNLDQLRQYLGPKADALREEDATKASRLNIVIRADRDAFWQDVQLVLQACADPRIRIYRILFAAVPEGGGPEGAMAVFLAKDVGPPAEGPGRSRPYFPVRLKGQDAAGFPPGPALYAALEKAWKGRKSEFRGASLDAEPNVSAGAVLEAIDALLRWNAGSVVLRGTTLNKTGSTVAREGRAVSRPGISLLDGPVGPPAKGDPVPAPLARVTGRMAGQSAAVMEGPEEEPPADNAIGIGGGAGGLFGTRRGNKAGRILEEGGEGTDAAVLAGLDWLARHQSPVGDWDSDGFEALCKKNKCGGTGGPLFDPGVTGLALLAFLGCGESHKTPRYGATVRNGLKYLKGIQDAEGCFGPRTSNHFTYNHALSALAMIEAYGFTESPLFKASAQNGVNFVLECRNPYLAWRYGVQPKDNDTSITGWMVMALNSAKGAGLDIDPDAFEGANSWLDRVTEPKSGRTGYTNKGNGPARPKELMDLFPVERTESLTALAVLARLHCGAGMDDDPVRKGLDLCLKVLPKYDEADGSIDFYYWHFGSLALFQAGGDRWKTWNEAMKKALLGSQKAGAEDDRRGSWDPMDPWGVDGGRIYATAINTLTLETYYRYPRIQKLK